MSKEIKNCIIDNRVSDDKQLFGNGLDDQKIVCDNLVNLRGWKLLKTFSKSHSGRKVERGDFEETVEYIKKLKKKGVQVHFYVVKSIDRFTRNGAVTYDEMKGRLDDLGVQLIDAYGIIQPQKNTLQHLGLEYEWSIYSPSETSELMEATRGKAEVRDILTRMVGAEAALTRKGFSMRAPNDGYINTKSIIDGKEQSVLSEDESRSHFYRILFELRATGSYTDVEIVKKINSAGYRSKPKNRWKTDGDSKKIVGHTLPKKMTVKQLQKVVLRTMYAGVKCEKWNDGNAVFAVLSEGSKPIVPIKVFNEANRGKVCIRVDETNSIEVLYNYSDKDKAIRTRKKYHKDYRYDKMIVCAVCSKPLKNSGKGNKGKLGTYYQAHHCDRTQECKKQTGRIPKDDFESKITYLLDNLKFNKGFENKLEIKLIQKYREREREIVSISSKMSLNLGELKSQQESLLESLYLTKSDLVRSKTEEKIDLIQNQIDEATEERDKIEIKERDIKSFVKYSKDLVEHLRKPSY